MQSSWQRIARETLRCSAAQRKYPSSSFALPKYYKHKCSNLSHPFNWRRTLATSATSPQQISTPTTPGAPHHSTTCTENHSSPTLAPSRQALAAAKAIRHSVASGNLPDAYLVVNSIYYAKRDKYTLSHILSYLLPQNAFKPTPIPFSPVTPTRLVTHTLLHSLVKHGYRVEARRLTEQLEKNGISVANSSLAFVNTVLSSSNAVADHGPVPMSHFDTVNILKSPLTEHLVGSEEGKQALRVLNVARESRQKRSLDLYRSLIRLCIINGEIILASLVFGLLVRDWNARVVDFDAPSNTDVTTTSTRDTNRSKLVIEKTLWHDRPTPFPEEEVLGMILECIEEMLQVQNPLAGRFQNGAIQALANLAALLDHRTLPTGPSPLIYLLSRIDLNRGKDWRTTVHVPIDRQLRTVDAQRYFDGVLTRLCEDPPSIAYTRSSLVAPISQNKGSYMPALDVTGYKHLGFFALVKKHSYDLAKSVVDHMRLKRNFAIQPDQLMIERFKQAAMKTRDERFLKAAQFLETGNRTDPLPTFDKPSVGVSTGELARDVFLEAIRSRDLEQVRLHIDFLVKNNQSDLVHEFLPALIPGYRWRNLDREVEDHYHRKGPRPLRFPSERSQQMFEEDARRAMANGPKLITSVLTALHRSRKTRSADRVWCWAKQMEEQSWKLSEEDVANDEDLRPWTLPISAYTVMLQLRAGETRSVLNRLENGRMGEVEGRKRIKELRRSTMRIYSQAVGAGAEYGPRIEQAEQKGKGVHKHHELAVPDAVFFNAILDAVGADLGVAKSSPNSSMQEAVERVERTTKFYLARRENPWPIPKSLFRVGKDMLEYGYPIPWGLRALFVGTGLDHNQNDVDIQHWRNSAFKLGASWGKKAIL